MTRRVALIGAGCGIVFALIALWVISRARAQSTLPTATASWGSATSTLTATEWPTITPTITLTPSETATLLPTATATATVSTLVLEITAINPDVTRDVRPTVQPSRTVTPLPSVMVPSPAATLDYMPTGEALKVVGWLRYGVDNPALVRKGTWEVFTSSYRSIDRQYLYSDAPAAVLTLRFLGAAVRVRYARYMSYGVFEVRIDGQVMTTVDSYLSKSATNGDFVTTDVFVLTHGWHTLEIRRLDRRNPDSTGGFVAIDGVDVYANGPEPTVIPAFASLTPTFTPSPAPVQRIQVLVAPPTIPPTVTPAPPIITSASLTVAYDENGNKAAEPSEGIVGLPVQLITADTNRVVATGVTDSQGFIRLEATGITPLRLVVPYFNRFWDIAPRTAGTRITLLLPPSNRPALIP